MQSQAASATAAVEATIVDTITISARNGLGFGDIASSAAPGTVILTSSGARMANGGTTINTATAASPATFDIQGTANASFAITLPASIVLIDGSSNKMTVNGFTSTPLTNGVLDSSGQLPLYVGATLNVDNNQPYGTYTGQMAVTVEYN